MTKNITNQKNIKNSGRDKIFKTGLTVTFIIHKIIHHSKYVLNQPSTVIQSITHLSGLAANKYVSINKINAFIIIEKRIFIIYINKINYSFSIFITFSIKDSSSVGFSWIKFGKIHFKSETILLFTFRSTYLIPLLLRLNLTKDADSQL